MWLSRLFIRNQSISEDCGAQQAILSHLARLNSHIELLVEQLARSEKRAAKDANASAAHDRKTQRLTGAATFFSLLAFVAIAIQAWIAHDSEQLQLRAYLQFAGATFTTEDGKEFDTQANFENNGQTPVFGAIITADTGVSTDPESKVVSFPPCSQSFPGKPFTFNGKTANAAFTNIKIPQDELAGVNSGKLHPYILGRVCYMTAFKVWHFTDFCREGTVTNSEITTFQCGKSNLD